MEMWLKITLMLCVYGVLKETRPSEPFITKYLINPPMNFTTDQVSQDIYPVSIYSMLILCVVIFLITDLVRYKPIIILLSTSAMSVYLMLIFGRSLIVMQILEVLYGLFSVCEVAYYTYIYAKVDKSHYQEVTGYTRAAYLVGRAVSGIISQTLVSSGFSYYSLNIVTFVALTLSGIWALFLPPVESSIYFNPVNVDMETGKRIKTPFGEKLVYGFKQLWKDFVSAFKSFYVVKWAFWWALATCCYYQILQYVQPLWEQILEDNPQSGGNLNGAVETAYTLISAGGAYGFGKLQADWAKHGELVLCLGSLLIAGILFVMSRTSSIIFAYGTYILYALIYNSMMTISNSEVAKTINPDSYGLIFGFTTFIALLMQSLLTIIVIEDLNLDPKTQFLVYGGYFAVLSAVFAVKCIIDLIRKHSRNSANLILESR
uniref:Thiamine transporter 1 n=1 Tax=Lygus hesperus TaxID=30085 RepID=A0A0A9Z2L1_LYGHE